MWRACSAGMFPTQTLCWWRLASPTAPWNTGGSVSPTPLTYFSYFDTVVSVPPFTFYFWGVGGKMVQTHGSLSKNAGRERLSSHTLCRCWGWGWGVESQEQADLQASAHLLHPLSSRLLAPSTPQISTRQQENLKGIPRVQRDMGVLSFGLLLTQNNFQAGTQSQHI